MVEYMIFREILDLLKPFDYVFISGMAMEIYTNGKRKANDIGILINSKDIEKFAGIIGCKLTNRVIKKEDYYSEDYGGEASYNGQMIEITSGFPRKRMQENTISKLFDRKVKRKYNGFDVYAVPIEELMVHKSMMQREKDAIDLALLRNLHFDQAFIRELARDFGNEDKVIKFLRKLGYAL